MAISRKSENTGSNTRDVNAARRAQMAIDLRIQCLSWEEIARRVGFANRGACYNAVQRELKRRIVPKVDEYRERELDILDAVHQKVWPLIVDPDKPNAPPNLWAVDRVLKISEARRQLLNLDVRPDEELAAQNYIKRIVLTHTSIEVESGTSGASSSD